MKKQAVMERAREAVALKMKRFSAQIRVMKENLRRQVLKEVRVEITAMKKKKMKKAKKVKGRGGPGRAEKWPNRCYQCCHRHFGGRGGVKHQDHLCSATEKWLARQ